MSVLDTFFAPSAVGHAAAAILESITDAVYIVDRRWRFVYLNPQAEVMLKRSREELLGQGIWDAFPEGVGTTFYHEYRRALASGDTARFEAFYAPLDTWVEVRAYPSAAGLTCYCHDITARKREEVARRAAEARYRALLQHDQDVTLIVGPEGRLRYISPAVERVLGYPAAGLVGAHTFRWIHPDDLAEAERAFRDLLARPGTSGEQELRVRHADGTWRWVEACAANLLDDPDITGLVVTYRDITERRAAADALRTQYRAFPVPTYTWRRVGDDFALVDYNDAALALTAGGIVDYLGRRRRDVYAACPEVVADFDRCLKSATSVRRELRHRLLTTGEERAFVVTYVPLAPDAVMVHTEDITARARAEAALRAREAMLAEAQRLAHLGSWEYDPETGALAWSDETYRILGLAPGAIVPTLDTLLAAIHPDDRARVASAVRAVAESGDYDVTYRIVRPDGEERAVHARGELVADADGGRQRLAGAVLDITEREAALEALRRSEARLAEAQRLAHVGSWEWDIARDDVSWSDETYRILGHPPRAFAPTQASMLAAVHPDDRDLIRRGLAASFAGHPPDGLDHRVVRPDGAVRVVRQRAELVRDAQGRPVKQVGVMLDITERRALEARLQHQAFHDALTGLPNRALFRDRLGQALARAARDDAQTCALLLMDLDRFKTVNDSLGHAIGDQLLVAAVARLRAVLREGDTLARLGGDEFVALLDGVADLPEALRVAEGLHAALAEPLAVEGRALFATVSIGVALRSAPEEGPEDLLRFADAALYRAKEAGRACTEAFYPGMSAAALERLELEHDLRRAVAREELRVHYQPKVDLTSGQVVGLEALVRWQHPERGMVAPGAFIPLAEETGLIAPIGRWVLGEACCQLVAWQERHPGKAAPLVSVNISARQFRNPDLAGEVAATLADTGLDPGLLKLEITETAAMAQLETSIATLAALRNLGVRLAIDDFGAGYSSLAYLQSLPVDTLKIDRSFFEDVARNRAIVRAVTDLAHGLGLDVTAEGLETAAQVAWAREAGCDRGQGYYFGRPLPADELEALWAAGLRFALPDVAASYPDPRSGGIPRRR